MSFKSPFLDGNVEFDCGKSKIKLTSDIAWGMSFSKMDTFYVWDELISLKQMSEMAIRDQTEHKTNPDLTEQQITEYAKIMTIAPYVLLAAEACAPQRIKWN